MMPYGPIAYDPNSVEWFAEVRRRMDEIIGPTRLDHLVYGLAFYARCPRHAFDVIYLDREPSLNVALTASFARDFHAVLTHRQNARKLIAMLGAIRFADGTTSSLDDIWMLNCMPVDGITIADLDNADLADAEVVAGDGGETIREMIRLTYCCRPAAEEDWFVRRWIAS
jgi:hypothetical protein